jgi:precorrin-3B C17-methyltransferase
MTGKIFIVGLGPGGAAQQTPQATAAITAATDLVGYGPYVERAPQNPDQIRHISDNREELARARHALNLAMQGKTIAILSSGDSGVFGMASAVFEAIDKGDPAWRALDIEVVPGISAMFATAARVGAFLGHDFCALSLSDNLKPWELVLSRLHAAATAGFVIALYNPLSRARPWQLGAAFERLRTILPPTTPVIFATAVTRPEERIDILALAEADPQRADMRTLVMIGTEATRLIARDNAPAWAYTPRSAAPF